MRFFIVFIISLSALFLVGCQTNPVTGETEFVIISPEREKEMGADYAKEVEKELGKSVQDVQLQNYISSVGQSVAKVSHMADYGFSYKAIDHNSVNAFAIPGGYIYITTGMLKQMNNEAQLAAVLGHETAHVTARHIANQMTRDLMINLGLTAASYRVPTTALRVAGIVAQLEGMSFTRTQERQADQVGLDYLVKAGYTPNGMIETMEILERQSESKPIEFLSTHPSPENRIELIRENIFNNRYSTSGKVGAEEYSANVIEKLKQIKPQQQK
ncbi:MAG: hypothetical protein A2Y10_02800 [Planctomycetes bacterium GWF2_41_51]|nr:MAG: hypothetical protein A2Y10_02800 [Planctomycetes bacterium GWF2_41_51]HBG27479.1 peptidase M48 Ste24p [Phycisphaerales bacterium]